MYCVVADESVGRQVPLAFLERVKDDFVSKYGAGKAATAAANSLNKEFGYQTPFLDNLTTCCVQFFSFLFKVSDILNQCIVDQN